VSGLGLGSSLGLGLGLALGLGLGLGLDAQLRAWPVSYQMKPSAAMFARNVACRAHEPQGTGSAAPVRQRTSMRAM
jgi:hypothetical protein